MLNWWEELAVSVVVAFLHNIIKSKQASDRAKTIVSQLSTAITEANAALGN